MLVELDVLIELFSVVPPFRLLFVPTELVTGCCFSDMTFVGEIVGLGLVANSGFDPETFCVLTLLPLLLELFPLLLLLFVIDFPLFFVFLLSLSVLELKSPLTNIPDSKFTCPIIVPTTL